jgi:hypothetical protein
MNDLQKLKFANNVDTFGTCLFNVIGRSYQAMLVGIVSKL